MAVTTPEIRYARSGDFNIAYQMVGEGELDMCAVRTSSDRGAKLPPCAA